MPDRHPSPVAASDGWYQDQIREWALRTSRNRIGERLRSHVFRVWTACAVLAAYVYGWLYFPEMLTGWKRMTTSMIESGCDLLPYPWGDRIEATLGNFGLWVQITLAIIVFRFLMWLVILMFRLMKSGSTKRQEAMHGQ